MLWWRGQVDLDQIIQEREDLIIKDRAEINQAQNNSIEVDLSKPSKKYNANNDDVISEHKSEYMNFS